MAIILSDVTMQSPGRPVDYLPDETEQEKAPGEPDSEQHVSAEFQQAGQRHDCPQSGQDYKAGTKEDRRMTADGDQMLFIRQEIPVSRPEEVTA